MKTADLTGVALEWAVAKCEDIEVEYIDDGITRCLLRKPSGRYAPSANWAQGGPIIERERIGVDCDDLGLWFASYDLSAETSFGATGPTPLIAAMRCYVASKLGTDIEIPEGLQ